MVMRVKLLTVADLHQSPRLYRELLTAVRFHRPDIVALLGDFLNVDEDAACRLTPTECAQWLNLIPSEVVFIPGNHEAYVLDGFVNAWRSTGRDFHLLDGQAHVHGSLMMIGFPCFMTRVCDASPEDLQRRMRHLILKHGPPARALWLMHEPPFDGGTALATIAEPGTGCREWFNLVDLYAPKLVIFGHDHHTPLKSGQCRCRCGETVYVNTGQNQDGPLRYCVAEFTFAKAAVGTPTSFIVGAFQTGTIHLYEKI